MAELATTTVYGNLYVKNGAIICEEKEVFGSEDEYQASKNQVVDNDSVVDEDPTELEMAMADSTIKIGSNGIDIQSPNTIKIEGKNINILASTALTLSNSSSSKINIAVPTGSEAPNLIAGFAKGLSTQKNISFSDGAYTYQLNNIVGAFSASQNLVKPVDNASFKPKYIPIKADDSIDKNYYTILKSPHMNNSAHCGIIIPSLGTSTTTVKIGDVALQTDKDGNFSINCKSGTKYLTLVSNGCKLDTKSLNLTDIPLDKIGLAGGSLKSYLDSCVKTTRTINGHALSSNLVLRPRDIMYLYPKTSNPYKTQFLQITYGTNKKAFGINDAWWDKLRTGIVNKHDLGGTLFVILMERAFKNINKHYGKQSDAYNAVTTAINNFCK